MTDNLRVLRYQADIGAFSHSILDVVNTILLLIAYSNLVSVKKDKGCDDPNLANNIVLLRNVLILSIPFNLWDVVTSKFTRFLPKVLKRNILFIDILNFIISLAIGIVLINTVISINQGSCEEAKQHTNTILLSAAISLLSEIGRSLDIYAQLQT